METCSLSSRLAGSMFRRRRIAVRQPPRTDAGAADIVAATYFVAILLGVLFIVAIPFYLLFAWMFGVA